MGSSAICLPSQAWGPGESGERVLVGKAGRVWSHREAEHICIYTQGDSKKTEELKGEKQNNERQKINRSQKKATG